MILHLAIRLGLLAQGVVAPPSHRVDMPPVRVWLPDTLVRVGEPARVYVALRDSSYLAVLHVDASGRIRVLFPRNPGDPDLVPGDATFAVAGAEDSVTFRVPGPGTGSLLAVRSYTPFRFDGLVTGNRWDYERSLLLLPTAGNPFAALLDIADRIADGEAYNYDLAAYHTPGTLAARPSSDSVCFGCLAARHSGSRVAETGALAGSALAVDHSLAAVSGGTVVDCSSATLVDSFCGYEDNSVTTNVTETTVTENTSVVYPLYTPLFFPLRRVRRPPRAPAPPPQPAIALNLRRVPGRIVPPPPRRPPRIAVDQPWAPSHPDALTREAPPVPVTATAAPAPIGVFVRRAAPASPGSGPTAPPASAWGGMEGRRFAGTAQAARAPGTASAGAAGAPAAPARPVLVPSSAVARAYRNRPR